MGRNTVPTFAEPGRRVFAIQSPDSRPIQLVLENPSGRPSSASLASCPASTCLRRNGTKLITRLVFYPVSPPRSIDSHHRSLPRHHLNCLQGYSWRYPATSIIGIIIRASNTQEYWHQAAKNTEAELVSCLTALRCVLRHVFFESRPDSRKDENNTKCRADDLLFRIT